jgi:hypothetical protein
MGIQEKILIIILLRPHTPTGRPWSFIFTLQTGYIFSNGAMFKASFLIPILGS